MRPSFPCCRAAVLLAAHCPRATLTGQGGAGSGFASLRLVLARVLTDDGLLGVRQGSISGAGLQTAGMLLHPSLAGPCLVRASCSLPKTRREAASHWSARPAPPS
jgi:hypothetical protein